MINNKIKKFWEKLFACFPLIRHEPHRKRLLQQFFVGAETFYWVDIWQRYGDTQTDTQTQASNNYSCFTSCCLTTIPVKDTETNGMMGGVCEVCRWDGLRCHDIHTKFHKDWFRDSKVDSDWVDPRTHREQGYPINLLSFLFKMKKVGR
jgi:hypothetical protein